MNNKEARIRTREILSEIKKIEKEYGIISHELFDWKEIDGDLIKRWKQSIRALGGYLHNDPSCAGTDTDGFYISKKLIDRKTLIRLDKLKEEYDDICFEYF